MAVVKGVFAQPDAQLDYARAKLTFDRLIDPTISPADLTVQVDALVVAARAMAGPGAPDKQKLSAVRRIIYDGGPWNGDRSFSYDMTDPLGQKLHNTLLATYLKTRRGNCVSMPVLFLILADRMGVKTVALGEAPLHVFVRYTDADGKVFNLETTSGANVARDVWYRQKLPMTDRAVESGLYMRSLSRREAVAVMAMTVVEHLIQGGKYEEAIQVSQVILDNSPRNGLAMVKQGTAYAQMLDAEFIKKYSTPNLIPPSQLPRYHLLAAKNQALFDAADALGWTPVE